MPLSDHLPPATVKGPRCGVSLALDALDYDDRATLVGWLRARDSISAGRIRAALTSLSLSVDSVPAGQALDAVVPSVTTIERHRRGECLCAGDVR